MTASSSWDHLDHETRASTPQSTHVTDEEHISRNSNHQMIRQSQEAFLAPTQQLPLLTRDSAADFNEHLNVIYAKDVNSQTLSQVLLTRNPIQDRYQATSHLVKDEASHLAQSQHLPPASPPAITVTYLSPVSNPTATAAEDPRHTIPAPFNSVANSAATHHATGTPFTPTSPISGSLRSVAARTRTRHAPKQRKLDRHRISFVKRMWKRFRRQGPWTPACFHDKTAGENAIKRAEKHGF